MDKTKTKKFSTAAVCFAIVVAALCAVEYLPGIDVLGLLGIIYLPVFIAVLPLVLTFVFVSCGYYYGAAVSVLAFGGAAALGFSSAIYLAAAFLPLVIAASYMIISEKRLRTCVLVSAAAALGGIALCFFVLTQSSGMSVVEYCVNAYADMLGRLGSEEVSYVYYISRYQDLLTGAVTQEALEATSAANAILKMQDMFKEALNLSIVYFMIVYSLGAGYAAYIVPRAVVKKRGRFFKPLTKLKDYALPKRLWLAAIIFFAAAVVGNSYGVRGFDVLLETVFGVFMFVFMIQGFVLLLYFFDQRKVKKGLRTVLLIAAALFLRTAALPIIGLFENMFNLRKRMKIGKEQAKP